MISNAHIYPVRKYTQLPSIIILAASLYMPLLLCVKGIRILIEFVKILTDGGVCRLKVYHVDKI